MVVNIISINANGLADTLKRRAIFDYYRCRCDLLLLQETHSTEKMENVWRSEWGGKIFFSHGESNARGVAILAKRNFKGDFSQVKADKNGRIISANIFADNSMFSLINVYAPNADNPGFYIELINSNLEDRAAKKIFMGDFNLILDPDKDTNSTNKSVTKDAVQLSQLMDEFLLCDVWRIRNPNAKRFSWYRKQIL